MRILITGGFGFIGSRLGQYFNKRGYEVIIGSRKKRSSPSWLPGVKVALIKWDDEENLRCACDGIDVVLHCAGMNARDCAADPKAALAFNGLATGRLAHTAAISGVNKFIYFSTAHVYSDFLSGEISEDLSPSNNHPYAISHLTGENLALTSNQNSEMKVIVLRLSNIIGAPADKLPDCWGLVAHDLCRQAIETGALELRTSGRQLRDFMGISQLVKAVDYLISRTPSKKSEIFNVGGNYPASIRELAHLIQERFEKNFGFTLRLSIPEDGKGGLVHSLNYRIDRLLSSNFQFESKLENDIDELLEFCKHSFTQSY